MEPETSHAVRAVRSIFGMWTIAEGPGTTDRDAILEHAWTLQGETGGQRSSRVEITRTVLNTRPLWDHVQQAIDSEGETAVAAFLHRPEPPEVIRIDTGAEGKGRISPSPFDAYPCPRPLNVSTLGRRRTRSTVPPGPASTLANAAYE